MLFKVIVSGHTRRNKKINLTENDLRYFTKSFKPQFLQFILIGLLYDYQSIIIVMLY